MKGREAGEGGWTGAGTCQSSCCSREPHQKCRGSACCPSPYGSLACTTQALPGQEGCDWQQPVGRQQHFWQQPVGNSRNSLLLMACCPSLCAQHFALTSSFAHKVATTQPRREAQPAGDLQMRLQGLPRPSMSHSLHSRVPLSSIQLPNFEVSADKLDKVFTSWDADTELLVLKVRASGKVPPGCCSII